MTKGDEQCVDLTASLGHLGLPFGDS